MNDARFSMRLPRETLAFAQGYAARYDMTLTDLVLRYFDRLKANLAVKPTKAKRRYSIAKYVGIAKPAMSDREVEDAIMEHLSEKYA